MNSPAHGTNKTIYNSKEINPTINDLEKNSSSTDTNSPKSLIESPKEISFTNSPNPNSIEITPSKIIPDTREQYEYLLENNKRPTISKMDGKIHLIMGPMFSGKSTELLGQIRRYNIKKKKTIVIGFNMDNRYSTEEKVVTHDKIEYPCIKCIKLTDVIDKLYRFDVIGIDEGQFYPDLVEASEELSNMGKVVIIAALSGNFKREPFDVISKIISKCEIIQNVTAICFYCNSDANYTLRTTADEEELLIGGLDMYRPACRKCFLIRKH